MKREYRKCHMTKEEVGAKLLELSKSIRITETALRQAKFWSPVKHFWGSITAVRRELGISSEGMNVPHRKREGAGERKYKTDMKIRGCLKCHRPFKSRGNWNRICDGCKEVNAMFDTLAIGFPG